MAIGHDLSRTRSRGSNSIIRMVYDDNILQIILQIRETEIRNSLKLLENFYFDLISSTMYVLLHLINEFTDSIELSIQRNLILL